MLWCLLTCKLDVLNTKICTSTSTQVHGTQGIFTFCITLSTQVWQLSTNIPLDKIVLPITWQNLVMYHGIGNSNFRSVLFSMFLLGNANCLSGYCPVAY